MDHREFDNYLTLLASLLRIRGEQREVIAQELRAHLEDRLDDLLDRGVDRDTAVQMALEEFGDAAGLAANFSLLTRNRRRRWIVKVTTFSTAALVLLAIGVMAMWPDQRPGPAPQRANAQLKPPVLPEAQIALPPANAAKTPAATGTARTVKGEPAEGALQEKLAQRHTAEFVETPLNDVLNFLADAADVQIFINRKALESEGLALDAPITMSLKNVRLDMLLDLILEQGSTNGGLAYVERDGILIVSTMTNLEGASEVRVYNCRDLLTDAPRHDKARGIPGMPGMMPGGVPMGLPGGAGGPPPGGAPGAAMPGPGPGAGFGGGLVGGPPPGMMGGGMGGGGEGPHLPLSEAEQRAESLKKLLQTAVKPASWSDVGGIGTISEYNGLIVINHDAKTHQQVENVLKMLREAAGLEPGKTAKTPKQ